MLKYRSKILLLLGLFTSAVYAADAPQWYQVEVIVFKHVNRDNLNSEVWPTYPSLPTLVKALELKPIFNAAPNLINDATDEGVASANKIDNEITQPASKQTNPQEAIATQTNELGDNQENSPTVDPMAMDFTHVPQEQFKLLKQEQVLNKLADTQVILHQAWLQSAESIETAKAIHLFNIPLVTKSLAPQSDAQSEVKESTDDDDVAATNNTDADTGPKYTDADLWELDGTLTISKTNYFNVKTNLALTLPSSEAYVYRENPYMTFAMHQSRRLRPEELHYFDHPLFGVLVEIFPVEPLQE